MEPECAQAEPHEHHRDHPPPRCHSGEAHRRLVPGVSLAHSVDGARLAPAASEASGNEQRGRTTLSLSISANASAYPSSRLLRKKPELITSFSR
jgi:hypothetical protein